MNQRPRSQSDEQKGPLLRLNKSKFRKNELDFKKSNII